MTEPDYDDIASYAARLRVPRSWVRDAVTARRIHFSKIGRHIRFSKEDHEANQAEWRQPALNAASPPRPERARPEQSGALPFHSRPPRRRSAA